MSDSSEKPAGSSGKYPSFPGEPIFKDSLPSDQDYGYKPLSILAILGAVLGGLFVLTLAGGFGAAFLFGTPWIMSPWIIFLACLFHPFKLRCIYSDQSFR